MHIPVLYTAASAINSTLGASGPGNVRRFATMSQETISGGAPNRSLGGRLEGTAHQLPLQEPIANMMKTRVGVAGDTKARPAFLHGVPVDAGAVILLVPWPASRILYPAFALPAVQIPRHPLAGPH